MRLGRYELKRRLAVGGMAELFLTRVTGAQGFEKLVVLKRILPSFVENPEFTEMFLTEAKLAAGLDHPNIAQLFDFGEQEGTYFFTMEYVRGRNLRQVVTAARAKERPIPLGFVLHIITGILAGLHYAHERCDPHGQPLGIVHRDISPPNVLVSYDGDVKVVDFGIAKAYALGPATVTANLKGKLAYMSPEQCRSDALDRRSDLFSIGTLLWELTMHRRLFGKSTGSNHLMLLKAVEEAEIPVPAELQPDYPQWLGPIVLKALARDPADRFENALEFRMAIEEGAREARLALSSAHAATLMTELFPVEDRDIATLIDENEGTLPSIERTRQQSATHTSPGAGGTQRTRRSSLPFDAIPESQTVVVEPPKPRRHLAIVASIGAVLALSTVGALVLSGATATEAAPAVNHVTAPAAVIAPAPPVEPEVPALPLSSKQPPVVSAVAPARDAEPEAVAEGEAGPTEPEPTPRPRTRRPKPRSPSPVPVPETAPKEPEPAPIFMKPDRDRAPGDGARIE